MSRNRPPKWEQILYEPGSTTAEALIHPETGLTVTSGLTAAEYIEKYNKKAVLMPYEEAMDQIEVAIEKKYITEWEEISRKHFHEMFEVLPPEHFLIQAYKHSEAPTYFVRGFRMMEYTTHDRKNTPITGHYIQVSNVHHQAFSWWACTRRIGDMEEILKDFMKLKFPDYRLDYSKTYYGTVGAV